MASACVNNNVGLLPENFFDSPSNTIDWFNPRSSSSRDSVDKSSSPVKSSESLIDLDFSVNETCDDFEFRLEDPVKMLAADELFFDGKLLPLHVSTVRSSESIRSTSSSVEEILKSKVSGMDPYLFSPKAPRCSSGWRELLGLKKMMQNSTSKLENPSKTPSKTLNPSSLKHYMHRNPKFDPSLGLPLLRETDSVAEAILASISSDSDRRDQPRPSTDSNKSSSNRNPKQSHPPKVRLVRRNPDCNTNSLSGNNTPPPVSASANALGVSMDSPRMNSSGKVVFQSLERSSSSPSTFNGGPRVKYKGMERRSYSANVKVSPVLNVPVCSIRGSSKFGLGQLFPSPHKKAGTSTSTDSSERSERSRSHHINKQRPIA